MDSDGWCAYPGIHSGYMVVFHHLGEVVDLLLYDIGLRHLAHIFISVCSHDIAEQIFNHLLQAIYFVAGIRTEAASSLTEVPCVFYDVLRVVTYTLKITNGTERSGEVDVVMLAESCLVGQFDNEIHQSAVDEVEFFLRLVEFVVFFEIKRGDDVYGSVEIFHSQIGHSDDFPLGLCNCQRRGAQHIVIHIFETESSDCFHLFGIRDGLAYKGYQKIVERKDYQDCDYVEERMEHGKLGLRRSREHPLEHHSEIERTAAHKIQNPSHKEDLYPPEHMEKIAQLFEVPLDTLLDDYNLFLRNGQGEQIKAIRTKLGLTQKQYADKLGISLGNLKHWEQNRKQIFKSTWEKYFKQSLESRK